MLKRLTLLAIGLLSLNFLASRPACAEGHPYTLSLGVETPVGMSPQKTSEDSPAFFWSAKLNVVEKFSIFTEGKTNFKSGAPWDAENKFRIGLERPIGYNLTVFGAFERREDLDDNRYFVGCRWSIGGKL